jgi:hypothetical protein
MMLITEDMGEMPDVDAAAMDALLVSDGFGKFAVLSASDEAFIQARNDWQPDAACKAFMQTHDSDPWVLEYREGERQFRAAGNVTLGQVRQAFRSYLAGGAEWRSGFAWCKLEL